MIVLDAEQEELIGQIVKTFQDGPTYEEIHSRETIRKNEMAVLEALASKYGYGLLRIEPGLTWCEDE